jgi:hypothetical protein
LTSMDGWEEDPEAFERACLAEVERELSYPGTAPLMREPAGRELRGVRRDGAYPKTAIVVSFLNLKTGDVEEWRFPLWEWEIFRAEDGTMMGPDYVDQEIFTLLIEP